MSDDRMIDGPVDGSFIESSFIGSGDHPTMAATQPGPRGSTIVALFDAARTELKADVLRGAGGRSALERYSDRVDGLLRQLFADAGPPESGVAVLALGGYGRRHLCLQSDVDIL